MMLIKGKCHCGNISFALTWQPDPVEIQARACTCSFCTRHGGVWTSKPDGELIITVEEEQMVSHYRFGTRTAQFHVCARCGVVPVVTSEIDGRLYAVVNVNAFENVDASLMKVSSVTHEDDQDARLARRKRNWIGNVSVAAPTR